MKIREIVYSKNNSKEKMLQNLFRNKEMKVKDGSSSASKNIKIADFFHKTKQENSTNVDTAINLLSGSQRIS